MDNVDKSRLELALKISSTYKVSTKWIYEHVLTGSEESRKVYKQLLREIKLKRILNG